MTEEEILRDELESFDPNYQRNYRTLQDAAKAAGEHAIKAYWAYMATPEGQQLGLSLEHVYDHQADNERRRVIREKELNLTAQGRKWLNGR